MDVLRDTAALEALYRTPGEAATAKVAHRITPEYRAWIEAAPFAALATVGPEVTGAIRAGAAGTRAAGRTIPQEDRRRMDNRR